MKNSRYKNIVISGDIGTGTTTLAKALAEKLGWKYLSAGQIFRSYHKEHGIPLWDKMSVPEDIERSVDLQMRKRLQGEEGLVIEGHYSGWFAKDIKDVFRVLLVCDQKIATQRIVNRKDQDSESAEDIEKRRQGLRAKFKKLYSVDDYEDPDFFHLVIDTTKTNEAEALKKVLEALEA